MIHTSHSLSDTKKIAEKFVHFISDIKQVGEKSAQNVFGFSGDLGSGKTAFTQYVASLVGINDHVTSPTFVIQKRYPIDPFVAGEHFPFKTLIHIDAYRIEDACELVPLGFQEDIENPTNLILIEWPERIIGALSSTTPTIRFSFVSEHVRTIEFPAMMDA